MAGLVGCSSVASSVAATKVSRLRQAIPGVGVFRGDDLALLGQADLPAHRARRLGQDGLVAGATAATAYRAAAPVERTQANLGQLVKQLHQRQLGACSSQLLVKMPPSLLLSE